MCDPDGKYPNLSSSHRGKNLLRNAEQRPNNNANHSGLSEKMFIAYKVCHFVGKVEISLYSKNHCGAILIGFGDTYFVDTFCGLELGPKTQLAVSAACTKVKRTFKSFGIIRIKIPFVELYKECTICAILRVNTPICLAATEPKTCCAMLRRGPIIMQIPRAIRKK